MNETLPVLAGLLLSIALVLLAKGRRRWIAASVGIPLIALASVTISGEFRLSWTYLLPDAAEAAAASAAGFALLRRLIHPARIPAKPSPSMPIH